MSYYAERLAGQRLHDCYEHAPPRVRQYLAAEITFALSRIRATDTVLELGCGYGRVMKELAGRAGTVVGIDTSASSLQLARSYLAGLLNCRCLHMNALRLEFADGSFDVVLCLQNGLSAFHVDPRAVIQESIRVTKEGGRVLLSSYSERFWSDRLNWFERQAEQGLIGELDRAATGDGVIVCRDGFHARTISRAEFLALTVGLHFRQRLILEVDESSLFCELVV